LPCFAWKTFHAAPHSRTKTLNYVPRKQGKILIFQGFFGMTSTDLWKVPNETIYQIMYQLHFRSFSGAFLRAKTIKNPHPKSAEKLDNKGKTGDFASPVFLVWVTRLELAASTTPTGFLGSEDRRKTSFFRQNHHFFSLFCTLLAFIVYCTKCIWCIILTGMYQNYVPKNNALWVKESLYLRILYHNAVKKSSAFLMFWNWCQVLHI